MELDDALYDRVTDLSEHGDILSEAGRLAEAREEYERALALLPEPKPQWEAWVWLTAAVGDTYFLEADFARCREWFRASMHGPDAIGNPFLHLRLGQCALELGEPDAAVDELLRAYMGAGEEIFDEDRKYLDFLKSRVDL